MLLWVKFSHWVDHEFLSCHFCFLLYPFVIKSGQAGKLFYFVDIQLVLGRKIGKFKTVGPITLVQVEEHLLFELILSVIDCNTVVVSIQSMSFCNSTWFLNVTNVRSCLSWLGLGHHSLLIDWSKSVNHNSAFDRLNWINDDSYRSRVQHFLWFLSFDICAWKPRSKPWMRVVPTDAALVTTNLFHHFHKLLLVHWIHRLHRDCCAHLRHWENIDHIDCVVVVNLANHETHNFKRNSRCTMLHHL